MLHRALLERQQSPRRLSPQWADEGAIVLVGHRPRAVVELELLQRRERTIPLLEELQPSTLRLVDLVQRVGVGLGLPEERESDEEHTDDRERRGEDERQRQRVAGTATSLARAMSRRCSRPSGQSVISDPRRKTSPAIQMRFTSGLTNTRK